MVEIEIGVMRGQCLARHDQPILFAGQQDISFTTFGVMVAGVGALPMDTTAGWRRAGTPAPR